MTRNQAIAIQIIKLLKIKDNASAEYHSDMDCVSFWFNYGQKGVESIEIFSYDSDIKAGKKLKKIAEVVKNELVERDIENE